MLTKILNISSIKHMCRVIPFKEAIKQAYSTGITRAYPHVSICINASIRIIPVIHMLAQTRRISRCPWRPLRGRAARASGERRDGVEIRANGYVRGRLALALCRPGTVGREGAEPLLLHTSMLHPTAM